MQKKTEGLFVGLCLMAVAVLCGIGIGSSYTEQNVQTTYSVVTDRVPAVLQVMDENVKGSIHTIVTVAENTMQVQKEMLLAAQAKVLAVAQASAEAEGFSAEQARAEAEAQIAEQAKAEAEALAAEQARAEAEAFSAEQVPAQAETATVPAEDMVTIPDEETATVTTPDEGIEQENAGEVNVQEKMTASELLQCINAERSIAGLAPLSWSDELATAAGVRSVETVTRFEHTRPDGTDFFTVSELAMAENLARGTLQTTAQEIVDKWMESTGGHRQNILDSGLYTIGIAVYEKDGQLTICALFG